MTLRLQSPYEGAKGVWRRGNLHAHTTNSDGEKTPNQLVSLYSNFGYDWICISDHDTLTLQPEPMPEGLTFLPGNEITARGPHLLHIGATKVVRPDPERAVAVADVLEQEGLCILNHPNWGKDFTHWPQDLLESISGYHGIEIYNGIVRRLEGTSLATDRWDRLLSKGIQVWGFANDDAHEERDYGVAWNVVRSENGDPASILHALKRGLFYASTGVRLSTLESDRDRIRIVSNNGSACVVVVEDGVELGRFPGRSWEFRIEDLMGNSRSKYVRFEILGDAGAVGWTQPIFLEWS